MALSQEEIKDRYKKILVDIADICDVATPNDLISLIDGSKLTLRTDTYLGGLENRVDSLEDAVGLMADAVIQQNTNQFQNGQNAANAHLVSIESSFSIISSARTRARTSSLRREFFRSCQDAISNI